jgi:hypothetical protein
MDKAIIRQFIEDIQGHVTQLKGVAANAEDFAVCTPSKRLVEKAHRELADLEAVLYRLDLYLATVPTASAQRVDSTTYALVR